MVRETRLRFHRQPQGAVWYHLESSRSHVLIDPRAGARAASPGFVRPIELWRADRWQRPPSVNVVRYLDDRDRRAGGGPDSDLPPAFGTAVNLASVVDFISDVNGFRLGALGALIDAVAAALDERGPPVVLAAPDADQGALWIGAVSFLAPPPVCLQLSFSTHERWDGVLAQLAKEAEDAEAGVEREPTGWSTPVVSVVAQTDIDRLSRRDRLPVVVIDPRVDAVTSMVDGRPQRRTHLGQLIPVTDWSRLALDACCEEYATLERCLRQLDEFSLAASEDEGRPDWPLAAAVALTGRRSPGLPIAAGVGLREALTRLDPEPAEPNQAEPNQAEPNQAEPNQAEPNPAPPKPGSTPPGPHRPGRLSELVADLTSLVTLEQDAAERAWARLRAALAEPPINALTRAAFETYLVRALADDRWLLAQAPPLPTASPAERPSEPVQPSEPTQPTDPTRPSEPTQPSEPLPPIEPVQLIEPGLAVRLAGPLAALVARLTENLPTDDGAEVVRRGVLMVRGVDFADRICRLIGGPDLAAAGIATLADRATEVLLDDTAGPKVAALAGPVSAAALADWIVPRVGRPGETWVSSANPVGERLPASVVALLAAAIDPAELIAAGRTDPLSADQVALEVAAASAAGRIAGDPRLRGPAVEYRLHRAAAAYPDADPGPIVTDGFSGLAGDEPWTADALLRLVERAPAGFGAELVPIALRHLPDWADDPLSARLAAALLKRIEFLPPRGADGHARPRRAGITDDQVQVLNLIAASGAGWRQLDDGLHQRAAEILMWGDRVWADAAPDVRRLIAPRMTVAAFQVALAAEPDQARTLLRARLAVVPIGSGWRSAVTIGLEPALPMIAEVLALNRFRLAGELVVASTRVMLNPARELTDLGPGLAGPDVPRLSMLPVGPVVRWLVTHQDGPALKDHLAALVEQELRDHVGPMDRAAAVRFWEQALPEVPIAVTEPGEASRTDPVLEEVLQIAFGLRNRVTRPSWPGGLSGLLPHPEEPAPDDPDLPSELLPNPHRDRRPDGPPPRRWRWWMAR